MTTVSIASRLASDGLQSHLFSAPSNVGEACKAAGEWCWSSGECCSGWCSWAFHCGLKDNDW